MDRRCKNRPWIEDVWNVACASLSGLMSPFPLTLSKFVHIEFLILIHSGAQTHRPSSGVSSAFKGGMESGLHGQALSQKRFSRRTGGVLLLESVQAGKVQPAMAQKSLHNRQRTLFDPTMSSNLKVDLKKLTQYPFGKPVRLFLFLLGAHPF
jgi:hypothetical protein